MKLPVFQQAMLKRHLGILRPDELERLSQAVIAGAGAGGIGGWTYIALARLGCRRFKIADPESFDASNVNRQAGSGFETMGRNKAEVVAEELLRINPGIEIDVWTDGVSSESVEEFVRGADIVYDGIDVFRMDLKRDLLSAAYEAGLPVLTAPVLGFGTSLALFDPKRSPTFEEYFGPVPDRDDREAYGRYIRLFGSGIFGIVPKLDWADYIQRVEQGDVPSVGTACMLSGAISATAIVACLTDRPNFPAVPETIHIDLMQRKIVHTRRWKRWVVKKYAQLFLK